MEKKEKNIVENNVETSKETNVENNTVNNVINVGPNERDIRIRDTNSFKGLGNGLLLIFIFVGFILYGVSSDDKAVGEFVGRYLFGACIGLGIFFKILFSIVYAICYRLDLIIDKK